MRTLLLVLASFVAIARDGISPRPSAADYPARQSAKNATLAAAVVPAEQVRKMFSDDVAKQYTVVEVAVYPVNGDAVDVDALDFSLKSGNTIVHAEKPRDVAMPWPEKSSPP